MNEGLNLILPFAAGILLGALFFGGLWWTLQKGVTSPHLVLWLLGSLLLRMSITLAGFYFVSGGQWERLLACLLGFVVARMIVTRLTRTPVENSAFPAQEANHAPQS